MTSYASDGGKGCKVRPTKLSYRHQDMRRVLACGNGRKPPMEISDEDFEGLDELTIEAMKASPRFNYVGTKGEHA